jgi:hypothetical protein
MKNNPDKEIEIQDENLSQDENNGIGEKPFPRRKIGAILFGAILGASVLAKEKSANAIVSSDTPILTKIDLTLTATAANIAAIAKSIRDQLDNFNTFMKPFTETVDNVKKVSDSWNGLISQINKVMDATEKSRDFLKSITDKDGNIFYVQATQLANYVTKLVSGNSDWAKVRLKRFDWYSQALVRAMDDISSHYQAMYNAWDRASRMPEGNKGSPESRIFIAGANQQLKAAYHEVRAIAFQKQFEDIQKKVAQDALAGKLPDGKSESDVIAELSKQMMIQLQIENYLSQVEILNSLNLLILYKNPAAFTIPKNMKMPKPEDYKGVFNSACNGDSYPGNYK